MVTATQMRKLALAMPAVEEKSHFGKPDFRVRGKIFAGLSPDGKRGTLKLSPDVQSAVLDAKPKVFSPAPGAWGRLLASGSALFDPVLAVVFPQACPACQQPLDRPTRGPLCGPCWLTLPRHAHPACACGGAGALEALARAAGVV